MTKTLSRPEISLLLLIVPVMLWAAFAGDAIDIHLHDTYFVFGPYSLSCWLSALIVVEALIYFVTSNFRQRRVLQKVHVYSFAFFVAAVLFLLGSRGNGELARYYEYGSPDAYGNFIDKLTSVVALAGLLAFFAGHMAFIVNVVAGFIKGKKATL